MPFYARTHAVLKLGPNNFDPQFWETAIGRPDVRRLPLVTGNVRDTVSQFSPPARFGRLYRKELESSRRISVYLYANVLNIDTDSAARTVTKVDVATLSGRHISVRAKLFVLATGGIENARLLLASNRIRPAGLGNGHDLVGRFYMDHPRLMSAEIQFSRAWSRNKLYDIKYHYQNAAVSAHGTRIASQFALTAELLQRERLLNARVWFFSRFAGEGSKAAEALIRCKQGLLHKDQPGWKLGRDLVTMASHPTDTAGFALTRILHPRALIRSVKLQAIVEAEPNPDSRVTLSEQKDQLGMNRVRVAWQLTSNVQRTFDRTFALIAEELQRSGVAAVKLDAPIEGQLWPVGLEGTWHHMGTTRMHDSPGEGVVDRNCKVHGMTNLFIAGSSVFPTVGANFPTITIVALTLRLAGHIAVELSTPQAMLVSQPGLDDPPSEVAAPAPSELAWAASIAPAPGNGLLSLGKQ
jgi:choline dehydrogenase-like flavoprotein